MLLLIVPCDVRRMVTAMLRAILISAILLIVGCGEDSEKEESIKCHNTDFDKVGQNAVCPDAGIR